jgi:hypothetical protein
MSISKDAAFYAALESKFLKNILGQNGSLEVATGILEELHARFGTKSAKVIRLTGLLLEALGRTNEAQKLYSTMLETLETTSPSASSLQKRPVAISRSSPEGKPVETARLLKDYLNVFNSDIDAWIELSEVQLAIAKAQGSEVERGLAYSIFCTEEALLLNPKNAALHARAAELQCRYATLLESNGKSALLMLFCARLHASESVKLSNKKSAYCLAALADASYLHACTVRGISHDVRLLSGEPIENYSSSLRLFLGKNQSQRSKTLPPAADSSKTDNDIEDDLCLHAVALQSLRDLALMSKSDREGTARGNPKGDNDDNGLKVEEELLSAPAGEVLRRQAERLTLLQTTV